MTPLAVLLAFLAFGLAVAVAVLARWGAAWEAMARRMSMENDLLKARLIANAGAKK